MGAAMKEVLDESKTTEDGLRLERDTECWTNATAGKMSHGLHSMLLKVHPDQDYSSAETTWLCRLAYDLGRKEGAENV